MVSVTDKVKKKVTKAKDKVLGTANKATGTTKEKISSSSSSSKTAATKGSSQGSSRRYEEGAAGTTSARTKDPTREYDEKEPMSPAKIKQHEPTAVRRDPSDQKIVEGGRTGTSKEEAAEKARRSGMTKGTAGAADTGSEYEQGAAGANK
ncbi:MAG: hypothetical protein ACJ72C_05635 [Nitrososphaeraceae archaeon]